MGKRAFYQQIGMTQDRAYEFAAGVHHRLAAGQAQGVKKLRTAKRLSDDFGRQFCGNDCRRQHAKELGKLQVKQTS